jgi:hypothetical protein
MLSPSLGFGSVNERRALSPEALAAECSFDFQLIAPFNATARTVLAHFDRE